MHIKATISNKTKFGAHCAQNSMLTGAFFRLNRPGEETCSSKDRHSLPNGYGYGLGVDLHAAFCVPSPKANSSRPGRDPVKSHARRSLTQSEQTWTQRGSDLLCCRPQVSNAACLPDSNHLATVHRVTGSGTIYASRC